MTRAAALLDRPGARSFGMVPAVVEADGGELLVLGLSADSAHRGASFGAKELDELVRADHALPVDGVLIEEPKSDYVALWLGNEFAERSAALQLPPAPLPLLDRFQADDGIFIIGPSAAMYVYLEQWVVRAFARFRVESSNKLKADIAALMRWTLPHNPLTLAAWWAIATNQENAIKWQLQSFGRGQSRDAWVAGLKATLDEWSDPLASMKVVAFTGAKGTLRGEIAKWFAEAVKIHTSVHFASFRQPIAALVSDPIPPAQKTKLLQEIGQREVERSPLEFTLRTFQAAVASSPHTIVVDSVRHECIRDVLRWRFGDAVQLIGVTANEDERRQRIVDEGGDPNASDAQPTEFEIPKLVSASNVIVDDKGDWKSELQDAVSEASR